MSSDMMLERVESIMNTLVEEVNYDEVSRLFATLSGGKRLRAKLIFKIAATHKDAPLLSAIVELIHAASLLHDDVIDDADLRRGVASVNATEGSKTAIMLGDILYSKGFSALVAFDKPIAKCIANSVTALSKGEMMDVAMAESFNDNAEKYLEMLYFKTATLIEAAAEAAALLEGKDAVSYALYGKNLGLSFQIIDDILDIVSDEATLGKPALHDYVEGKCTLPYIYLYHDLNDGDKIRLKALHKKELSEEDSLWIKAQMKAHKSIERSFILARKLSDEAIAAVDDDALKEIIEVMMKRNF
ncbi:MAG: polyprenyl synthetase family protein [Campylobacterota bacterium]|nr:polyprenyl synthetase family protein [Campylobacterota bacterium]